MAYGECHGCLVLQPIYVKLECCSHVTKLKRAIIVKLTQTTLTYVWLLIVFFINFFTKSEFSGIAVKFRLTNMCQCIVSESHSSPWHPVTFGVFQNGDILDLLLAFYIKNFFFFPIFFFSIPGDITRYKHITSSADCSILKSDFDHLSPWSHHQLLQQTTQENTGLTVCRYTKLTLPIKVCRSPQWDFCSTGNPFIAGLTKTFAPPRTWTGNVNFA